MSSSLDFRVRTEFGGKKETKKKGHSCCLCHWEFAEKPIPKKVMPKLNAGPSNIKGFTTEIAIVWVKASA